MVIWNGVERVELVEAVFGSMNELLGARDCRSLLDGSLGASYDFW